MQHWMARKTILKFPKKATKFCTKIKSYLPFSMNFNAIYVIHFSLTVELIKKQHSPLRKDAFMI